jgi:guanylate kinase
MTASIYKIVVVAAPSGAGKSSVTGHLLSALPDKLGFSISAATRPPRNYEKNGVDYYFITVEEFEEKIQNDDFVEWEMVYEGKYYGTLKSELVRIWQQGKTPLLDVDVVGGVDIQGLFPGACLSLFIMPPSLDELKRRLEKRGTETPETLKARLQKAEYELTFKDQFDHIVINNDLHTACLEAEKLVREFLLT